MSRASHIATFVAGALVASAFTALAVPRDTTRFRTFDAFAQTLHVVETNYVDPVDEHALLYDATRGMIHNLDKYSTYLPPNRYQKLRQDTEGEFGGIGIVLAPGELDDAHPGRPPYPIVDEIIAGSPADVAGLQLDDRITAIDGTPTAEAGRELKEAGAWEAKLRGASGTRVAIDAIRVGWKDPRHFTIVRAQVKQPSVTHRVLAPHVGYIAIARFAEATANDVAAALADLKQHDALGALVLDLRSDPGGLVDQAIAVADHFLDHGTIVTIQGRQGSAEHPSAHPGGPAIAVPVIALVDQGTASAAEILAAALHDNGRAKLVGTPTYGKGTVQTFYDLDDGSGLKLTTARYLTPKGNSLESKGITPDVRVEAFVGEQIVAGGSNGGGAKPGTNATITSEGDDDPQLAAAVQLATQAARGGIK